MYDCFKKAMAVAATAALLLPPPPRLGNCHSERSEESAFSSLGDRACRISGALLLPPIQLIVATAIRALIIPIPS